MFKSIGGHNVAIFAIALGRAPCCRPQRRQQGRVCGATITIFVVALNEYVRLLAI
jgi:hypothetical protein